MPNLTKTLTVYEGADLSPARDRTDVTIWESTELTTMGHQGEAGAGSWVAHETTTLGASHVIFARPHNLMKLTVGSNTLWQGRVATRAAERGETVEPTHRLHSVTTEDQNSHLRGIIVHDWARPAETDAARVQALVAAYLSGNPRASTNLNGSNFVVTGSNTTTLPAQTYSGMEPFDVLGEIAEATDKTFFVSVDDELHYYGNDYTGYASSLRISDDHADLDTSTCVPITPSTSEVSRDVLTAQRTYWQNPEGGDERSWLDENVTIQNQLDYWEGLFHDSDSPTRAIAEQASRQRLRANDRGEFTHTVTIGKPGSLPRPTVDLNGNTGTAGQPMTGDDVWRIKPGQTIQFKSSVLRPNGLPNFTTRRVRSIRWTFPAADSYFATLEIEQPKPLGPKRRISRKPRPAPQPAPPFNPNPGDSAEKFYNADDPGGDDVAWLGAAQNQGNPGGGANGTNYYINKSALPNRHQTTWAASAGDVYRVEGYIGCSSSGILQLSFTSLAAGSPGAFDITAPDVLATHNLSPSQPFHQHGPEWTAFSAGPFTAPSGTTSAALGRTGGVDFDELSIYLVGDPTENDEFAVDYGDCPADSPFFLPSDYIQCQLDGVEDQLAALDNVRVVADTDPTEDEDADDGYVVGTIWVNESTGDVFILVDNSSGAAVWLAIGDSNLFVYNTDGGKEVVSTVAASGSTETLDLADGNWHDLTLTDDCTLTFSGATNGTGCSFVLILRQDGTGGRTVTWPASVAWPGGEDPTLSTDGNAVDIFSFLSNDGGTTWFGAFSGSVTATTIRDIGHWEVIVSGSAPPVAVTNEAEDDWVYGWVSG